MGSSKSNSSDRGLVTVQSRQGQYLVQDLSIGSHSLVADEPEDLGGQDLGPTPYGFLLSALGACTSMTLQMFAKHKGIDLQSVNVQLQHERIHAKDCKDCESESGKVDQIFRKISLEGDLSSEQRQRLLEIADRCPVHKTLQGELKIRTELT